MKKKVANLKKLSLNKSCITSLSGKQQQLAVGGANTLIGGTSPCGPCDFTKDKPTCLCLTQDCETLDMCPATVTYGCDPTAVSVCVVC